MAKTQKNKSTEGHLGLLEARIAKLRREQVETIMCDGGAKGVRLLTLQIKFSTN